MPASPRLRRGFLPSLEVLEERVALNAAPVFGATGYYSAVSEGQSFSFQVSASDADGDSLAFAASGLPQGLGIDAATGRVSGIVGYATAGSPTATLTVSDGHGGSATVGFAWSVSDIDRLPAWGSRGVTEGVSATIDLSGTDNTGTNTPTYTASGLPTGLAINASTGLVTGVPGYADASPISSPSNYPATVTLNDGHGGIDTRSVAFLVTDSPILSSSLWSGAEGGTVSLDTAAAGAPAGLSYTSSPLPQGLAIDFSTGRISGIAGYANTSHGLAATLTATVTALGPGVSETAIERFAIADTDRLPSPGMQATREGLVVSLDMHGTDNTGTNALAYSASDLPHGLAIDPSTGLVAGTVAFDNASLGATASFVATVTLADDHGGTDTRTVSWLVVDEQITANDDSYTLLNIGPYRVEAAGVLANDSTNSSAALAAVLATGPAHGTLALDADGGFTYTPSLGYVGADSFTYRASDSVALSDPATVHLTVLSATYADDTTQETWLAFGEAEAAPRTGELRLAQPLRFDRGGVAGQGPGFSLVYDSGSVDAPIIEVAVPASGVATNIAATLTWDGQATTTVNYAASGPAGTTYVLDLQAASAVTATGVYGWQADVTVTYADSSTQALVFRGAAVEVSGVSSAYGAGWDLAGAGRLVVTRTGVIRLDGLGGERFFLDTGSATFQGPAGEHGTLERSGAGYLYTAADRTAYRYDAAGLLLSVVDADSLTTGFSYDSGGRLTLVATADGGSTTLAYSSAGLLGSIVEPGGRTLGFGHDGSGNLTSLSDADGSTRWFGYGYSGHQMTSDGWSPYASGFSWSSGRLTGIGQGTAWRTLQPALLRGTGTLAAVGSATTDTAVMSDGTGGSTTYGLDATHGWLLSEARPAGPSSRWSYDGAGDLVQAVDPDGLTTGYAYDGYGDLTAETLADGAILGFSYDPTWHRLSGMLDGAGHSTSWSIDPANGHVLAQIDGAGSGLASSAGYSWSAGLLLSMTDGVGDTTSFAYDTARRVTSQFTQDAAGTTVDRQAFAYGAAGFLASSTVGVGSSSALTTSYARDGRGDLLGETTPGGRTMSYSWTAAGFLASETDGRGTRTSYSYDGQGQETGETDDAGTGSPENWTESEGTAGLVTLSVDPVGNTTSYAYDADERVSQEWFYDASGSLYHYLSFTYDGDDNVLTQTDGDGRMTSWAYDGADRVTLEKVLAAGGATASFMSWSYDGDDNVLTQIDGAGNTTSYAYDARNRLSVEKVLISSGATASVMSYAYDGDDNVLTQIDGAGNTTSFAYDGAGRVTWQGTYDASGSLAYSTSSAFDLAGRETLSVDGAGNTTSYAYDGDGLVLAEIDYDASGSLVSSMSWSYDGAGNVLTETDGAGNTTSYAYDGDGDVLSEQHYGPSAALVWQSSSAYDLARNLIRQIDGAGNTTSYTYLGGRLVSTLVKDSLGATVSSNANTFDDAGDVLTEIDGEGNTTSYTYDGAGQLLTEKTYDAGGTLLWQVGYSYDQAGEVLTQTEGNGNTTSYTYSGGQLVSSVVTDSLGTTVSSQGTTYDRAGNVLTQADGAGNTTSYSYLGGQLVSTVVKDSLGATVSSQGMTYDGSGNVLTQADGAGNITSFTYLGGRVKTAMVVSSVSHTISSVSYSYDMAGNVLTQTDGAGDTTSYMYFGGQLVSTVVTDSLGTTVSSNAETFDQAGDVLTDVDGAGNTTSYTYLGGRVATTVVKDSLGTTISSESLTYDAAGNVRTRADAGGTTSYAYDGAGRRTAEVAGWGSSAASTTRWGYDTAGNVAWEADADSNTTSYSYDAGGHVLTKVTGLGTTSYAYDLAGELTYTSDPTGRWISYGWQGGRLTGATWHNADGSVADVLGYTYDGNGQLLTAGNNAGTYTFTYDGGWVDTEVTPDGLTLSFAYDPAGHVTSQADSQGATTSFSWSGNDLVRETYQDGTYEAREDFAYDAVGRVTLQTRYADLAGSVSVGHTSLTYHGGRAASIESWDGNGTVIASYGYGYDSAMRLTLRVEDGVSTTFSYDAQDQLLQAGSDSYSYDANGNNTAGGASVTANNQLTTDGTWAYSYDAAGNVTSRTDATAGLTWSYSYDVANHLTHAVETDATNAVLVDAQYGYDAFGNRTSMVVAQGGTTTTTHAEFAAAGAPSIEADLTAWRLYADMDSGGTVGVRYLSGDQPNAWLAQVVAGAGTRWTMADHQGSLRLVTDATGAVIDAIAYDAYGVITTETAPAVGGREKWDGYEWDEATRMYRSGARFYLPEAHIWTTQDPSGLAPDANPYRYVGNGPTNATDPSGLDIILLSSPHWGLVSEIGLEGKGLLALLCPLRSLMETSRRQAVAPTPVVQPRFLVAHQPTLRRPFHPLRQVASQQRVQHLPQHPRQRRHRQRRRPAFFSAASVPSGTTRPTVIASCGGASLPMS